MKSEYKKKCFICRNSQISMMVSMWFPFIIYLLNHCFTIRMEEEKLDPFSDDIVLDPRFDTQIRAFLNQTFTIDDIGDLLECVRSDDLVDQHKGVIGLGNILIYSTDRELYDQVTRTGIVLRIVQLLRQDQYPHLKMQAIQLISNIADCNTRVLFEAGVISDLLQLIGHREPKIQYYAITTLTDFLMEQGEEREEVLLKNGASILLKHLQESHARGNVNEEIFHPLSYICLNRTISFEEIKNILVYFAFCLEQQNISLDQTYKRIYNTFSYQGLFKRQVYQIFANNRKILINLVKSLEQSNSYQFGPPDQRYFKQLLYLIQVFTKQYEDFMPRLFEFDILKAGTGMILTDNKLFKSNWYKILNFLSNHQCSMPELASHYIIQVTLSQMKSEEAENLTLILSALQKIFSKQNTEVNIKFLKTITVFTYLIDALQVNNGTMCNKILKMILKALKIENQYRKQLHDWQIERLVIQQDQLERLQDNLQRLYADQNEKMICKICEIQLILASQP